MIDTQQGTVIHDKTLGRAKNAVLDFLQHRLYIPKIYLDAEWKGEKIDVLAIDRDGSGDVHAALLFTETYIGSDANRVEKAEAERNLLARFQDVSAQFKWICRIRTKAQPESGIWSWKDDFLDSTFAPDGIGRVGFILVDLTRSEETRVAVELKPERFRAFVSKLADAYVAQHSADWEIRA